jgi:hypothetical protein
MLSFTMGGVLGSEEAPRTDPDGIIRLLHIGKAWFRPNHPAPVINQDPRISYHPVPSHYWTMGEEALRNMRLYLPRSERLLFDNYDVILEDGMDAGLLSDNFHHWMRKGVEKEGMGFLMADDSSSFASGRHTSWYLFPIGDVLPVTDVREIWYPRHGYHVIVDESNRDHPLVKTLSWETMPRVWAHNRPTEKEGAIVLARMSPELVWNRDKPVIVYWDFGKGRSLAYVHKWHGTPNDPGGDIPGNAEFYRWKWHVDLISHLIYLPARVPIPEDLTLVHAIRLQFNSFRYRQLYLLGAMEFADKFGANLARAEIRLEELMERRESADTQYLAQDLDACHENLAALLLDLDTLTEVVIAAREGVMLWIFILEWLVVSATSMIAGTLLWSLMVRRRLYKDVGLTRLVDV